MHFQVKLKIEQSNTKFYTPVAGLYFIGHTINKQIPLWTALQKIKKKHGIANIDFIRIYSGLPAQKRGEALISPTITGLVQVLNGYPDAIGLLIQATL